MTTLRTLRTPGQWTVTTVTTATTATAQRKDITLSTWNVEYLAAAIREAVIRENSVTASQPPRPGYHNLTPCDRERYDALAARVLAELLGDATP